MGFYPPAPEAIKKIMRAKGYMVFGGSRGYDLNIFGIRTNDMKSNAFNDWLGVMWLLNGVWNIHTFPATTDPGTYYRLNPANVKGTAILKPGQYRGAYQLGKHRGAYDALVQANPVTVYRDANRDDVLDVDENNTETGLFGINIHRASSVAPSVAVDKWSAGCQVFQDPIQFQFLINLAKQAAEIFGNHFTYTLLTEQDFEG